MEKEEELADKHVKEKSKVRKNELHYTFKGKNNVSKSNESSSNF